MLQVDIGVFAHNEQQTIALLINDLEQQTIFQDPNTSLRLRILCNGCTDDTFFLAQKLISQSKIVSRFSFVDNYTEPGKSITWNRFVNELPVGSDFVVFIDGDIRIKKPNTISNLIDDLRQSTAAASTSRPIKDVSSIKWNPLLRAAASLIGREHKDGPICGQLYAVKTEYIRDVRLPVPCLVEDGFLSACLVTDLFAHPVAPHKVKASLGAQHHFKTPGSFRDFFYHDVRLSLGCELNAALYSDLWVADTKKQRIDLLSAFSESLGIEKSIENHLKYPQRSALQKRKLVNLWGNKQESAFKKTIKIPFRIAHHFYMKAVRRTARKLFNVREFQW